MRWRVGQGNRQLHQAALFSFIPARPSTCRTFIPTNPFHQYTGILWPAVALQARRQENLVSDPEPTPRPRIHPDGGLKSGPSTAASRNRAFCEVQAGATVEETPIPKDHAGAIDALCRGWTTDQKALGRSQRLQSHAGLFAALADRDRARELTLQMGDTKRPQRAVQALVISWSLGCRHKYSTYEEIAHHLAQKGQWRLVIAVASITKEQTGRLTHRLLDWRTRALVETQSFAELNGVLDMFEQEKLVPKRRTYHLLISGHLQNRDLAQARQCLVAMQEVGIAMDGSTHALIVAMYRSFGADPTVKARALSALPEVDEHIGTRILNSSLQAALDAQDLSGALRVLGLFGSQGATASSDQRGGYGAHTTLADGEPVMTHRSARTAIARWPLSEDAATFTILLNHLAGEADVSRSAQVIAELCAKGVRCDSHLAAAIVRMLFAARKLDIANGVIHFICRHHAPSSLLNRIGPPGSVNAGLLQLLTDVQPSIVLFNAVLQGVMATHGLSGVRAVQAVMKHIGVAIDEHTVQIYLEFLDKSANIHVRELVSTFRRMASLGIHPTINHLNIFLSSVLRKERALLRRHTGTDDSDVNARVAALPARRLTSTTPEFDPTASIQLPSLEEFRQLDRALIRKLRENAVRSDRATFALRIRHAAVLRGDLDGAEEAFRRMVARGMHPNRFHYAALLEGYAIVGDVEAAEDVLRRATASGVVPNVVLYTLLIKAYAHARDPAGAVRAFKRMVEVEIHPDATAVLVLAKAFLAKNARADARRALVELWSFVGPFPEELQDAPLLELLKKLQAKAKENSPERGPLSKQARRMLRWKATTIMRGWERTLRRDER